MTRLVRVVVVSTVLPRITLPTRVFHPVLLRPFLTHPVPQWIVTGRLILVGRPVVPCLTAALRPLLLRRLVFDNAGVKLLSKYF